jgi:LysM repeat protein
MSYDAIGRRLTSEQWQKSISTEKRTGGKPVDWTYWYEYSGDIYLRSTYSYNDLGQVSAIDGAQLSRAKLSDTSQGLISTTEGPYNNKTTYAPVGPTQRTYYATYHDRGYRISQSDYYYSWLGAKSTLTSSTSTNHYYRGDYQLTGQITYASGRLAQISYFSEGAMLNAAGQQESYRYIIYNTATGAIDHSATATNTFSLFDTYKEQQAKVTRTNGGSPGTTVNTYTERGELLQAVGTGGNIFTRKLAVNAEGQLTTRQEVSGTAQSYLYYQGAALANVGNASAAEVSDTFTPISSIYHGSTPGNYVVNAGDTLSGIAQAVWGDSHMWYLIADANGLDPSATLTPGDSLKIPNVVSSTHSDATTFKPYNPGDVIGDTEPRTINPAPPPPPKPKKKKKSGGLKSIVMAVVAVVAAVFTAGAALVGFGAFSAGFTAGMSAVMSAGVGAFAGGSLAAIGAAGLGAAVGSAASQAAGMAMGVVDKFSWSQVAVAGITAGIGAGVGGAVSGWSTTAQITTTASASYVGNYAASKVAGLDASFSWSGMAASVISSIATSAFSKSALGQKLGMTTDNFKGNLARSLVGRQISTSTQRLMGNGGKMDYAAVAADAFGNAIGNGLVEASLGSFFGPKDGQPSQREIEMYKAELATNEAGRSLNYDNAQASVNWYRGEMSTDIDPYIQMLGGDVQDRWIALKQQHDAENTFGLLKPLVSAVEAHAGATEFALATAAGMIVEPTIGVVGLATTVLTDAKTAAGFMGHLQEEWRYELRTETGKSIAAALGDAIAPALEKYEAGKSSLGDYGLEHGGAGWATALYTLPDAAISLIPYSRAGISAAKGAVLRARGRDAVPSTIATASSGQLTELLSASTLSKRQFAIYEKLSSQGSVGKFSKKSVSMSDLRAISQVTGDEYSMFTLGSQRTVIRGYGNEISVPQNTLDNLLAGNYGKWSGHTHPPGYSINPGPADRPFLQQMGQQRSAIWGDNGHYTFGQLPSDDAMIQSEIMRKQWAKIYGGN